MSEKLIGAVTHYFDRISVAVVKINKGMLAVGDTVKFVGSGEGFQQVVGSLEIDRLAVGKIKAGQEAGMKVDEPVKSGWAVYKVEE